MSSPVSGGNSGHGPNGPGHRVALSGTTASQLESEIENYRNPPSIEQINTSIKDLAEAYQSEINPFWQMFYSTFGDPRATTAQAIAKDAVNRSIINLQKELELEVGDSKVTLESDNLGFTKIRTSEPKISHSEPRIQAQKDLAALLILILQPKS